MLITPDYVEQNRILHSQGEYGTSGHRWKTDVEYIAKGLEAKTILDYGAGQQGLAKAVNGYEVRSYDPAIPEIAGSPDPADLVVCADVLEHIEPHCLDDVLDDIKRLAVKGVFLVIATRPAKKTLPDGRNAHLIQANASWWIPKLMSRWDFRQITNHQCLQFMFFGLTDK